MMLSRGAIDRSYNHVHGLVSVARVVTCLPVDRKVTGSIYDRYGPHVLYQAIRSQRLADPRGSTI